LKFHHNFPEVHFVDLRSQWISSRFSQGNGKDDECSPEDTPLRVLWWDWFDSTCSVARRVETSSTNSWS